jgi:hypothetical protein
MFSFPLEVLNIHKLKSVSFLKFSNCFQFQKLQNCLLIGTSDGSFVSLVIEMNSILNVIKIANCLDSKVIYGTCFGDDKTEIVSTENYRIRTENVFISFVTLNSVILYCQKQNGDIKLVARRDIPAVFGPIVVSSTTKVDSISIFYVR